MKYAFALSFLWLLATTLLILTVTVYSALTLEFENRQGFPARMGAALGKGIRLVLLINNGWCMIFFTMALLSLGITLSTQFERPPLVSKLTGDTLKTYQQGSGLQALSHAILDWDIRTDNPKEMASTAQKVAEHGEDFASEASAWPWFSCGILMLIVAVISIPVVLFDEVVEIWHHIRERHNRETHTEGTSAGGGMIPKIFDRLMAKDTPHATSTATSATPPPAPGAQTVVVNSQPAQASSGISFGKLLLTEFLAELSVKILRGLFKENLQH